jgi:hypothetical protein
MWKKSVWYNHPYVSTAILVLVYFTFFEGYVVAQLVEALRHKPGGRGFDYGRILISL